MTKDGHRAKLYTDDKSAKTKTNIKLKVIKVKCTAHTYPTVIQNFDLRDKMTRLQY